MTEHKIDEKLRDKFAYATASVRDLLRPADGLTDDEARTIIKRYVAAIEGNFLAWMGGASVAARSVVSKFAADENLWVETKDDHPGMLRAFAVAAQAEPDAEDFQYIGNEVTHMRGLVSELSGLKNIAVMATLENTSVAFIPYLAALASRLGAKGLTYTDVHGEADVAHADQFLEALSDEQQRGYQNPEQEIDQAIAQTTELLKMIFA